MTPYEQQIEHEVLRWKAAMQKPPSFINRASKRMQEKVNSVIPEKIHEAITVAIKQMTRMVILGAEISTTSPPGNLDVSVREYLVKERIKFYRNTATAEGAMTGAAGFLVGLADFPLWLSLKMKMLFEIASAYGADVKDYKERIYLLYIFQLTFSSQKNRNDVFRVLENWKEEKERLPPSINEFNWRTFQQEYRDYIDIAKLLQLVPGIGAVVGAVVNHRLTEKLGETAMNAYRMRWPEMKQMQQLPPAKSI